MKQRNDSRTSPSGKGTQLIPAVSLVRVQQCEPGFARGHAPVNNGVGTTPPESAHAPNQWMVRGVLSRNRGFDSL